MNAGADRFRGTARWYSTYRPGLEHAVREALLEEVAHIGRPRSLLDLGTGTGQVVDALGDTFDLTVGVDNEPEMINEARRLHGEDEQRRWLLGSAEDVDLPPDLHPDLITIARAFHWMDERRVLERYARVSNPTGRLVVLGDRSLWTSEGPWQDIVRDTIRSFLGEKRRAGAGTFQHHTRPYDEVIAESPFSNVHTLVVPVSRTWTTDSVLGYLYSTSFSSQELYGERLEEFEMLLRDRLDEFQRESGRLEETVDFTLFVGSLP